MLMEKYKSCITFLESFGNMLDTELLKRGILLEGFSLKDFGSQH